MSACRILAMVSRIGRVRVVHTGQDAVAGGRAMSGRQGSEQSAGARDFVRRAELGEEDANDG